ncbi:MAG: VCBS repeat-containing protein [Polyangiales bacterium]
MSAHASTARLHGVARTLVLCALGSVARCADTDAASVPSLSVVPWQRATEATGELAPEAPARVRAGCGPCSRDCSAGDVCAGDRCVPQWASAPRLLLPASLGRVTSRRPTLRWVLPQGADGARVELCRERACDVVTASFEDRVDSARPPAPLAPGVHFWRVFPRFNGEYSRKASATWSFVVRPVDAEVDTSFGRLNDVNGDGYADVLVSTSRERPVGIYFGSPRGVSTRADLAVPPSWEGLPARVGAVGDVNGDGFGDLLVRASRPDGGARLLLIPGGARPSLDRAVELTSDAPWALSVTGAGDLDGDGFGDLLGVDPETPGAPAQLRVWYGTPSGVYPIPRRLIESSPGSGLSATLAALGDLNGDTLPDLVLGAASRGEGAGGVTAWINGGCHGGELVELGAPPEQGGRLGDAVALASDADGDGLVEALAAQPFSDRDVDRSRIHVFPGDAREMDPAPGASVALPGAQQEGIRLVPSGDLNGDGYSDVVVWAHSEQRGPSFSLFYGSARGVPTTPARVVYPQEFGATETALSVGLAGDTDRDGYDDLLVFLAPGQALIARGGPDGPRVAPTPFLTLP